MKNNFVMAGVFTIICGITSFIRLGDILLGVITGVLTGTAFLLFMSLVTFLTKRGFIQKQSELSEESVLISNLANLTSGRAPSTGWLMLTDSTLTFVPHRFNWKRTVTTINRKDIELLEVKKSFGLVENIIGVQTVNQSYIVVVDNPREWVKLLEED